MSESVSLSQLTFKNRFTTLLPGDSNSVNSRRQVHEACYSEVLPTPVAQPAVIAYSREVAELIGVNPADCESQLFADVFGGNLQLEGMRPFAMCYGGHQFGNWAGQLGDGRAINLGEVSSDDGHWTLQLKGAGPTPYSRTADGLAVLRSSIREFLCSEAMFHLGVPTTRALSLVLTGEKVRRDMFYDGNPAFEPGAVVCRVAPSFTRFGNFQLFASRGETDTLRTLIDFTIRNDFPHLLDSGHDANQPIQHDTIVKWFDEVCQLTCDMIVQWMRVGFVHGVMNTDNMSILGLTIDYGPYGWLEDYNPGWTPNTTDSGGRYSFGNQPVVAHWNLYQLANAVVQITEDPKPLEACLENYADQYNLKSKSMMCDKLGLKKFDAQSDETLIGELLDVLPLTETDMTIFFRRLADLSVESTSSDDALVAAVGDAYYKPEELTGETLQRTVDWLRSYTARVRADGTSDTTRRENMNKVNPKYVLRNYMAQLAIDAAEADDNSIVQELLDVLRNPYDEQPQHEQHAAKRPEWARDRAGCSMLSCSS
ncbi:YdiU family protein [bacterium]|nr:YdiU family protein [bacterium]